MKIKSASLFLGTAMLFLLYGILTRGKSISIALFDTYFVVANVYFAVILSVVTGIISLSYFGMEIVKRSINTRVGFMHFGLFIIGLLLLAFHNYYGSGSKAIILAGVILLLTSLVVFIYGVIKALLNKKQQN